MRFGGVLVRIRMLSAVSTPSTTPAPMSVISSASGSPSIQPKTPPASLSAGRPSRGCGRPPPTWQKPAIDEDEQGEADADAAVVVDGCRMPEQPAREQQQQHGQHEGDAADEPAGRVGADRLPATSLPMKNHSLTAPAIASSTMRNGRPSRRWSFSSVSGPKARNSPPVPCARPIQARTMSGGFSVSPT